MYIKLIKNDISILEVSFFSPKNQTPRGFTENKKIFQKNAKKILDFYFFLFYTQKRAHCTSNFENINSKYFLKFIKKTT